MKPKITPEQEEAALAPAMKKLGQVFDFFGAFPNATPIKYVLIPLPDHATLTVLKAGSIPRAQENALCGERGQYLKCELPEELHYPAAGEDFKYPFSSGRFQEWLGEYGFRLNCTTYLGAWEAFIDNPRQVADRKAGISYPTLDF
jgi:hypothetical protein